MSIHHWIEEAVLSPMVLAQRRGPIDCGNAARRRDHLRLRQGGVAGSARRRHATTMLSLASGSRRFAARQRRGDGRAEARPMAAGGAPGARRLCSVHGWLTLPPMSSSTRRAPPRRKISLPRRETSLRPPAKIPCPAAAGNVPQVTENLALTQCGTAGAAPNPNKVHAKFAATREIEDRRSLPAPPQPFRRLHEAEVLLRAVTGCLSHYLSITTAVAQIAADLLRRASWQSRATTRHQAPFKHSGELIA